MEEMERSGGTDGKDGTVRRDGRKNRNGSARLVEELERSPAGGIAGELWKVGSVGRQVGVEKPLGQVPRAHQRMA